MTDHISEGERNGFACRRADDCWFPECSCPQKPVPPKLGRGDLILYSDYWPKPIPDRRWDWAIVSTEYDPDVRGENRIVGEGPTEFDAIVDWLIQWEPQE